MRTPTAAPVENPLRAVLAAFRSGAGTMEEVARSCGLGRDVAEAAVEYLVRTGRLTAQPFSAGCPTGGCRTCPVGAAGAGCASPPGPRTGPVLLTLAPPR